MKTTKRRMTMREQVAGIKARQAAKPEAQPNQWGGVDYRGKVGIARTSVDDGETTVTFLSGVGQLCEWEVTFSSGAPAALIDSAIREARSHADGRAK